MLFFRLGDLILTVEKCIKGLNDRVANFWQICDINQAKTKLELKQHIKYVYMHTTKENSCDDYGSERTSFKVHGQVHKKIKIRITTLLLSAHGGS